MIDLIIYFGTHISSTDQRVTYIASRHDGQIDVLYPKIQIDHLAMKYFKIRVEAKKKNYST